MIDGDGCLSQKKNSFKLSLVGSFEITNAFNYFVETNIEISTKRTPKNRNGPFVIEYSGSDARKIAKVLYQDSSIHLIRKYTKAEKAIKEIDVNLKRLPKESNPFGVAGVYLIDNRFRVLFESKKHSIVIRKSFGIRKLGYDEALKLAIDLRKQLEEKYS